MMGLASSWRAEADEVQAVPQPVDVDLKHLATELDLFTAEARRARVATALIGSVSARCSFLRDSSPRQDGRNLSSTGDWYDCRRVGSIGLGSACFDPDPDGWNQKRPSREAMGGPGYEVHSPRHRDEWRDAAATSRRRRVIVGTTMLIVGTASLATGLTFLLAPSGLLGMSRKAQYTWGGVFMGSGIPVASLGVRFIFEWSAEETSWEAYRNMKADAVFLHAGLNLPSIGVLPIRGGALAFAALVF